MTEEQPLKEKNKEDFLAMVDRMEKANAKAEEILKRQEDLAARKLLGGDSIVTEAPKPKEDTPKEYVAKLMEGKIGFKK